MENELEGSNGKMIAIASARAMHERVGDIPKNDKRRVATDKRHRAAHHANPSVWTVVGIDLTIEKRAD